MKIQVTELAVKNELETEYLVFHGYPFNKGRFGEPSLVIKTCNSKAYVATVTQAICSKKLRMLHANDEIALSEKEVAWIKEVSNTINGLSKKIGIHSIIELEV